MQCYNMYDSYPSKKSWVSLHFVNWNPDPEKETDWTSFHIPVPLLQLSKNSAEYFLHTYSRLKLSFSDYVVYSCSSKEIQKGR